MSFRYSTLAVAIVMMGVVGCGGDGGAVDAGGAGGDGGQTADATPGDDDADPGPGIATFTVPAMTGVTSGAGPGQRAVICVELIGQTITYTLHSFACPGNETQYLQWVLTGGGMFDVYSGMGVDSTGQATAVEILTTTVNTVIADTSGTSVEDLPADTSIAITTGEFSNITFRITLTGDDTLTIEELVLAD